MPATIIPAVIANPTIPYDTANDKQIYEGTVDKDSKPIYNVASYKSIFKPEFKNYLKEGALVPAPDDNGLVKIGDILKSIKPELLDNKLELSKALSQITTSVPLGDNTFGQIGMDVLLDSEKLKSETEMNRQDLENPDKIINASARERAKIFQSDYVKGLMNYGQKPDPSAMNQFEIASDVLKFQKSDDGLKYLATTGRKDFDNNELAKATALGFSTGVDFEKIKKAKESFGYLKGFDKTEESKANWSELKSLNNLNNEDIDLFMNYGDGNSKAKKSEEVKIRLAEVGARIKKYTEDLANKPKDGNTSSDEILPKLAYEFQLLAKEDIDLKRNDPIVLAQRQAKTEEIRARIDKGDYKLNTVEDVAIAEQILVEIQQDKSKLNLIDTAGGNISNGFRRFTVPGAIFADYLPGQSIPEKETKLQEAIKDTNAELQRNNLDDDFWKLGKVGLSNTLNYLDKTLNLNNSIDAGKNNDNTQRLEGLRKNKTLKPEDELFVDAMITLAKYEDSIYTANNSKSFQVKSGDLGTDGTRTRVSSVVGAEGYRSPERILSEQIATKLYFEKQGLGNQFQELEKAGIFEAYNTSTSNPLATKALLTDLLQETPGNVRNNYIDLIKGGNEAKFDTRYVQAYKQQGMGGNVLGFQYDNKEATGIIVNMVPDLVMMWIPGVGQVKAGATGIKGLALAGKIASKVGWVDNVAGVGAKIGNLVLSKLSSPVTYISSVRQGASQNTSRVGTDEDANVVLKDASKQIITELIGESLVGSVAGLIGKGVGGLVSNAVSTKIPKIVSALDLDKNIKGMYAAFGVDVGSVKLPFDIAMDKALIGYGANVVKSVVGARGLGRMATSTVGDVFEETAGEFLVNRGYENFGLNDQDRVNRAKQTIQGIDKMLGGGGSLYSKETEDKIKNAFAKDRAIYNARDTEGLFDVSNWSRTAYLSFLGKATNYSSQARNYMFNYIPRGNEELTKKIDGEYNRSVASTIADKIATEQGGKTSDSFVVKKGIMDDIKNPVGEDAIKKRDTVASFLKTIGYSGTSNDMVEQFIGENSATDVRLEGVSIGALSNSIAFSGGDGLALGTLALQQKAVYVGETILEGGAEAIEIIEGATKKPISKDINNPTRINYDGKIATIYIVEGKKGKDGKAIIEDKLIVKFGDKQLYDDANVAINMRVAGLRQKFFGALTTNATTEEIAFAVEFLTATQVLKASDTDIVKNGKVKYEYAVIDGTKYLTKIYGSDGKVVIDNTIAVSEIGAKAKSGTSITLVSETKPLNEALGFSNEADAKAFLSQAINNYSEEGIKGYQENRGAENTVAGIEKIKKLEVVVSDDQKDVEGVIKGQLQPLYDRVNKVIENFNNGKLPEDFQEGQEKEDLQRFYDFLGTTDFTADILISEIITGAIMYSIKANTDIVGIKTLTAQVKTIVGDAKVQDGVFGKKELNEINDATKSGDYSKVQDFFVGQGKQEKKTETQKASKSVAQKNTVKVEKNTPSQSDEILTKVNDDKDEFKIADWTDEQWEKAMALSEENIKALSEENIEALSEKIDTESGVLLEEFGVDKVQEETFTVKKSSTEDAEPPSLRVFKKLQLKVLSKALLEFLEKMLEIDPKTGKRVPLNTILENINFDSFGDYGKLFQTFVTELKQVTAELKDGNVNETTMNGLNDLYLNFRTKLSNLPASNTSRLAIVLGDTIWANWLRQNTKLDFKSRLAIAISKDRTNLAKALISHDSLIRAFQDETEYFGLTDTLKKNIIAAKRKGDKIKNQEGGFVTKLSEEQERLLRIGYKDDKQDTIDILNNNLVSLNTMEADYETLEYDEELTAKQTKGRVENLKKIEEIDTKIKILEKDRDDVVLQDEYIKKNASKVTNTTEVKDKAIEELRTKITTLENKLKDIEKAIADWKRGVATKLEAYDGINKFPSVSLSNELNKTVGLDKNAVRIYLSRLVNSTSVVKEGILKKDGVIKTAPKVQKTTDVLDGVGSPSYTVEARLNSFFNSLTEEEKKDYEKTKKTYVQYTYNNIYVTGTTALAKAGKQDYIEAYVVKNEINNFTNLKFVRDGANYIPTELKANQSRSNFKIESVSANYNELILQTYISKKFEDAKSDATKLKELATFVDSINDALAKKDTGIEGFNKVMVQTLRANTTSIINKDAEKDNTSININRYRVGSALSTPDHFIVFTGKGNRTKRTNLEAGNHNLNSYNQNVIDTAAIFNKNEQSVEQDVKDLEISLTTEDGREKAIKSIVSAYTKPRIFFDKKTKISYKVGETVKNVETGGVEDASNFEKAYPSRLSNTKYTKTNVETFEDAYDKTLNSDYTQKNSQAAKKIFGRYVHKSDLLSSSSAIEIADIPSNERKLFTLIHEATHHRYDNMSVLNETKRLATISALQFTMQVRDAAYMSDKATGKNSDRSVMQWLGVMEEIMADSVALGKILENIDIKKKELGQNLIIAKNTLSTNTTIFSKTNSDFSNDFANKKRKELEEVEEQLLNEFLGGEGRLNLLTLAKLNLLTLAQKRELVNEYINADAIVNLSSDVTSGLDMRTINTVSYIKSGGDNSLVNEQTVENLYNQLESEAYNKAINDYEAKLKEYDNSLVLSMVAEVPAQGGYEYLVEKREKDIQLIKDNLNNSVENRAKRIKEGLSKFTTKTTSTKVTNIIKMSTKFLNELKGNNEIDEATQQTIQERKDILTKQLIAKIEKGGVEAVDGYETLITILGIDTKVSEILSEIGKKSLVERLANILGKLQKGEITTIEDIKEINNSLFEIYTKAELEYSSDVDFIANINDTITLAGIVRLQIEAYIKANTDIIEIGKKFKTSSKIELTTSQKGLSEEAVTEDINTVDNYIRESDTVNQLRELHSKAEKIVAQRLEVPKLKEELEKEKLKFQTIKTKKGKIEIEDRIKELEKQIEEPENLSQYQEIVNAPFGDLPTLDNELIKEIVGDITLIQFNMFLVPDTDNIKQAKELKIALKSELVRISVIKDFNKKQRKKAEQDAINNSLERKLSKKVVTEDIELVDKYIEEATVISKIKELYEKAKTIVEQDLNIVTLEAELKTAEANLEALKVANNNSKSRAKSSIEVELNKANNTVIRLKERIEETQNLVEYQEIANTPFADLPTLDNKLIKEIVGSVTLTQFNMLSVPDANAIEEAKKLKTVLETELKRIEEVKQDKINNQLRKKLDKATKVFEKISGKQLVSVSEQSIKNLQNDIIFLQKYVANTKLAIALQELHKKALSIVENGIATYLENDELVKSFTKEKEVLEAKIKEFGEKLAKGVLSDINREFLSKAKSDLIDVNKELETSKKDAKKLFAEYEKVADTPLKELSKSTNKLVLDITNGVVLQQFNLGFAPNKEQLEIAENLIANFQARLGILNEATTILLSKEATLVVSIAKIMLPESYSPTKVKTESGQDFLIGGEPVYYDLSKFQVSRANEFADGQYSDSGLPNDVVATLRTEELLLKEIVANKIKIAIVDGKQYVISGHNRIERFLSKKPVKVGNKKVSKEEFLADMVVTDYFDIQTYTMEEAIKISLIENINATVGSQATVDFYMAHYLISSGIFDGDIVQKESFMKAIIKKATAVKISENLLIKNSLTLRSYLALSSNTTVMKEKVRNFTKSFLTNFFSIDSDKDILNLALGKAVNISDNNLNILSSNSFSSQIDNLSILLATEKFYSEPVKVVAVASAIGQLWMELGNKVLNSQSTLMTEVISENNLMEESDLAETVISTLEKSDNPMDVNLKVGLKNIYNSATAKGSSEVTKNENVRVQKLETSDGFSQKNSESQEINNSTAKKKVIIKKKVGVGAVALAVIKNQIRDSFLNLPFLKQRPKAFDQITKLFEEYTPSKDELYPIKDLADWVINYNNDNFVKELQDGDATKQVKIGEANQDIDAHIKGLVIIDAIINKIELGIGDKSLWKLSPDATTTTSIKREMLYVLTYPNKATFEINGSEKVTGWQLLKYFLDSENYSKLLKYIADVDINLSSIGIMETMAMAMASDFKGKPKIETNFVHSLYSTVEQLKGSLDTENIAAQSILFADTGDKNQDSNILRMVVRNIRASSTKQLLELNIKKGGRIDNVYTFNERFAERVNNQVKDKMNEDALANSELDAIRVEIPNIDGAIEFDGSNNINLLGYDIFGNKIGEGSLNASINSLTAINKKLTETEKLIESEVTLQEKVKKADKTKEKEEIKITLAQADFELMLYNSLPELTDKQKARKKLIEDKIGEENLKTIREYRTLIDQKRSLEEQIKRTQSSLDLAMVNYSISDIIEENKNSVYNTEGYMRFLFKDVRVDNSVQGNTRYLLEGDVGWDKATPIDIVKELRGGNLIKTIFKDKSLSQRNFQTKIEEYRVNGLPQNSFVNLSDLIAYKLSGLPAPIVGTANSFNSQFYVEKISKSYNAFSRFATMDKDGVVEAKKELTAEDKYIKEKYIVSAKIYRRIAEDIYNIELKAFGVNNPAKAKKDNLVSGESIYSPKTGYNIDRIRGQEIILKKLKENNDPDATFSLDEVLDYISFLKTKGIEAKTELLGDKAMDERFSMSEVEALYTDYKELDKQENNDITVANKDSEMTQERMTNKNSMSTRTGFNTVQTNFGLGSNSVYGRGLVSRQAVIRTTHGILHQNKIVNQILVKDKRSKWYTDLSKLSNIANKTLDEMAKTYRNIKNMSSQDIPFANWLIQLMANIIVNVASIPIVKFTIATMMSANARIRLVLSNQGWRLRNRYPKYADRVEEMIKDYIEAERINTQYIVNEILQQEREYNSKSIGQKLKDSPYSTASGFVAGAGLTSFGILTGNPLMVVLGIISVGGIASSIRGTSSVVRALGAIMNQQINVDTYHARLIEEMHNLAVKEKTINEATQSAHLEGVTAVMINNNVTNPLDENMLISKGQGAILDAQTSNSAGKVLNNWVTFSLNVYYYMTRNKEQTINFKAREYSSPKAIRFTLGVFAMKAVIENGLRVALPTLGLLMASLFGSDEDEKKTWERFYEEVGDFRTREEATRTIRNALTAMALIPKTAVLDTVMAVGKGFGGPFLQVFTQNKATNALSGTTGLLLNGTDLLKRGALPFQTPSEEILKDYYVSLARNGTEMIGDKIYVKGTIEAKEKNPNLDISKLQLLNTKDVVKVSDNPTLGAEIILGTEIHSKMKELGNPRTALIGLIIDAHKTITSNSSADPSQVATNLISRLNTNTNFDGAKITDVRRNDQTVANGFNKNSLIIQSVIPAGTQVGSQVLKTPKNTSEEIFGGIETSNSLFKGLDQFGLEKALVDGVINPLGKLLAGKERITEEFITSPSVKRQSIDKKATDLLSASKKTTNQILESIGGQETRSEIAQNSRDKTQDADNYVKFRNYLLNNPNLPDKEKEVFQAQVSLLKETMLKDTNNPSYKANEGLIKFAESEKLPIKIDPIWKDGKDGRPSGEGIFSWAVTNGEQKSQAQIDKDNSLKLQKENTNLGFELKQLSGGGQSGGGVASGGRNYLGSSSNKVLRGYSKLEDIDFSKYDNEGKAISTKKKKTAKISIPKKAKIFKSSLKVKSSAKFSSKIKTTRIIKPLKLKTFKIKPIKISPIKTLKLPKIN